MKTIRPPDPAKLYHLECGKCRAVLECEETELRWVSDRSGDFHVLKCPHCTRETYFHNIRKYVLWGVKE